MADCRGHLPIPSPMPGRSNYTGLEGHTHQQTPATGVLLVNLGTPSAPTAAALRPYLAEFLGDPRVIELPRWKWWPILHGVILRLRPRRSAAAYANIWNERGSPLRYGSEDLADRLRAALTQRFPGPVKVALAMCYGAPTVTDSIVAMQRDGVRRLLVVPLYPQYSATSTGAVLDKVAGALRQMRWPPELRIVNDYHDDPRYIDALAASVRAHWNAHGRGERLLMSFHGIPERCLRAGDPYFCQCHASARLLREALGVDENEAPLSFQSRVGRERWLHPYTDARVRELGASGVKTLDVICPGFAVDCLETLEEIAMQNRDFFRAAGGEELRYLPALNAGSDHVSVLSDLVARHTGGWPETAANYDADAVRRQLENAARRARHADV